MQTIRTKVLFILLLFPAVILPTMMQASEASGFSKEFLNRSQDYYKISQAFMQETIHGLSCIDDIDYEGLLKKLIDEGVDINAKLFCLDDSFCTQLTSRAFAGVPTARAFVKMGADVNIPDSHNRTPLMREYIPYLDKNGLELKRRLGFIKLLLDHGAKDTGENKDGETIWTLAVKEPEIMELLKKHFDK